MAAHPMAPVDAAWYHIDGPVNFAMVTGILLTREALDFEKVKAVYRRRLARFDRFCQRVVETGFPIATPHWEEIPDFDIGQQLHHIALPEPCDRAALVELVSELAGTPLDRERPLWQVHVVDNVNGGSALIMRIHHCLADGTAAMAVCRELFDTTADGRARTEPPRRRSRRASGPREPLFVPALAALEETARDAVAAAEATLDAVRHPQRLIDAAAHIAGGAGMLLAELLKAPDPASPLKGEFRLEKRVAWSEPVALRDVKTIGAPSGAKINDVLVAGMTGALRAYLRKRGVDVNHVTLRAMVPVDLRPPGQGIALGNDFGLVILDLPVSERQAFARLRRTKERMDALKRSPEPVAILALFNLFGRVPKAVEDFAVDLFGSKASVVMTNVAGPAEALYVAGVPIERFMFWVPHPGRQLGMGISILSYKGRATLAVIADAHLVPDPEAITAGFHREFARMLKTVRRRDARVASQRPRRRSVRARTA
jgi:WS/DGAT/MGAT family acyltransferase